MKWEYLEVYLYLNKNNNTFTYLAHDGTEAIDKDQRLIILLGRLSQARWEYCQYVNNNESHSFHLLKREVIK